MSEEQFLRLERMIGSDLVEKLHRSHVTVAGAGAVGGFAFESLVRSGVGKIRIIDFDVFSETNLNRQILATHESIGRKRLRLQRKGPHSSIQTARSKPLMILSLRRITPHSRQAQTWCWTA